MSYQNLHAALEHIAEYPQTPSDELSAAGMRDIARAALAKNPPSPNVDCWAARSQGGTGPICDMCNTGYPERCRWLAKNPSPTGGNTTSGSSGGDAPVALGPDLRVREWFRGAPHTLVIRFARDITNEEIDAIPKALMRALEPQLLSQGTAAPFAQGRYLSGFDRALRLLEEDGWSVAQLREYRNRLVASHATGSAT